MDHVTDIQVWFIGLFTCVPAEAKRNSLSFEMSTVVSLRTRTGLILFACEILASTPVSSMWQTLCGMNGWTDEWMDGWIVGKIRYQKHEDNSAANGVFIASV